MSNTSDFTPRAAFSIRQFCRDHDMSIPTYYQMKRRGFGPAEMRINTLIRISHEAAAAWRHARENPGVTEAETVARTAKALHERARRAAKRAIQSPRHISRSGTRGR
jgi:hypothetical protein